MVADYSKHGNINNFIADYHPKSKDFIKYRKRWEENKDSLLYLVLETTSKCNLKCPICIHSIGYEQKEDMNDEIFECILKNIGEMKIPSIGVNFTNEPLLDKKIFQRVKKIANIDCVVDIHMNTNAALLNKENSFKILNSGLTRLMIGFDAFSKETYESMRVGASYEKVLKNILYFLDLKEKMHKIFPIVRISFVRSSINENEIEKWFGFWKDRVDYITIQEYFTPVLDNSKDYLLPRSNKRKEVDILDITCPQPFERAVIRGNGSVLPCCAHFATEMPIGNIKQNGLKDIWHGEKAIELRKYFEENRWEEHPICSKCLGISYDLKQNMKTVRKNQQNLN